MEDPGARRPGGSAPYGRRGAIKAIVVWAYGEAVPPSPPRITEAPE
ncbi:MULTISPECIES: hypothetical protein [Streptomyces violaceusniger group]|uniref:Uncharacterized protein n=1 Tax=Streptomyces javensis TaxID=114698 RepID=A0ABS0RI17_9ACTN|nr:hypothetical protein [Streptomyces javensis]MBI0316645.1 hypothetical protein [Streptomyces javensis]